MSEECDPWDVKCWTIDVDAMTATNEVNRTWKIRESNGIVEACLDNISGSYWDTVLPSVKEAYFKALDDLAEDILLGES